MTRNDDLRKSVGKRETRGSLRRTIWTRRARLTVLSVALGLASLPFLPCELGSGRAFAVSTVTSSSLQAAQSAASKSLYSRQRQQERLEAQRQAQLQAQAQAQAESQARAQRQAQAAQAAAQAQAQAQAESSKKSFLSDLFKREPVVSNSSPYDGVGTFNNYERAQFASRNGAIPNDGSSERTGLGLGLFKKKDGSEQARRQEYPSNQAQTAAPYGRTSALAGRPTNARGATPSSAVLAQASTSPTDSRDALAKVPWDLMPQQTRERLSQLASSPTLYRRLPMSGGSCNPELFDYFLSYPHAVVELWRASGYDGLTMTSEGNGAYSISEKGGSSGRIQIIYQDSELTLVHCYGSYVSPVFPRPLEGEAFLILQTRYTEDGSKTPLVVCRLDAFIGIKNMGAELLARTFNSFVGKVADANFESTLGFICGVSRSIEEAPHEFQRVAASLNIDANAKNVLIAKTQEIANQAQARRSGQTVEYRLLAKANAPQPGYARILARGDSERSLPNGQSVLASAPGVAKSSSSYGKAIDLSMNKSPNVNLNEFTLAPDGDFESSLDWDDDERTATGEEILASRRSDASTSVAKVGAKTTKNSSVIDLLEEQEESDAPNYEYDELATDSNESSDGALLVDDALLLDDSDASDSDSLTTGETQDSEELTMTLNLDESDSELKDSIVAIPYAAQSTLEDKSEEEDVAENDLIAPPNEDDDSSEDGDLLETLDLPEDLEATIAEDAPVVPLAATTKNPSSARARGLNAMKRAPKQKIEKETEPAVAKALTEAEPKEVENEEKTTALSETVVEDLTEADSDKTEVEFNSAPKEIAVVSRKNEDVEFEVVAQEIEANWTPVRDFDSSNSTFDDAAKDVETTRRDDGFQAAPDKDSKSTTQKKDEQTSPVFAQPDGSNRKSTVESDEEQGLVKRFVTRRFSPRANSDSKPIPSFRSVLKGEGDDEKPKVKPIERLKNVVNPNDSN